MDRLASNPTQSPKSHSMSHQSGSNSSSPSSSSSHHLLLNIDENNDNGNQFITSAPNRNTNTNSNTATRNNFKRVFHRSSNNKNDPFPPNKNRITIPNVSSPSLRNSLGIRFRYKKMNSSESFPPGNEESSMASPPSPHQSLNNNSPAEQREPSPLLGVSRKISSSRAIRVSTTRGNKVSGYDNIDDYENNDNFNNSNEDCKVSEVMLSNTSNSRSARERWRLYSNYRSVEEEGVGSAGDNSSPKKRSNAAGGEMNLGFEEQYQRQVQLFAKTLEQHHSNTGIPEKQHQRHQDINNPSQISQIAATKVLSSPVSPPPSKTWKGSPASSSKPTSSSSKRFKISVNAGLQSSPTVVQHSRDDGESEREIKPKHYGFTVQQKQVESPVESVTRLQQQHDELQDLNHEFQYSFTIGSAGCTDSFSRGKNRNNSSSSKGGSIRLLQHTHCARYEAQQHQQPQTQDVLPTTQPQHTLPQPPSTPTQWELAHVHYHLPALDANLEKEYEYHDTEDDEASIICSSRLSLANNHCRKNYYTSLLRTASTLSTMEDQMRSNSPQNLPEPPFDQQIFKANTNILECARGNKNIPKIQPKPLVHSTHTPLNPVSPRRQQSAQNQNYVVAAGNTGSIAFNEDATLKSFVPNSVDSYSTVVSMATENYSRYEASTTAPGEDDTIMTVDDSSTLGSQSLVMSQQSIPQHQAHQHVPPQLQMSSRVTSPRDVTKITSSHHQSVKNLSSPMNDTTFKRHNTYSQQIGVAENSKCQFPCCPSTRVAIDHPPNNYNPWGVDTIHETSNISSTMQTPFHHYSQTQPQPHKAQQFDETWPPPPQSQYPPLSKTSTHQSTDVSHSWAAPWAKCPHSNRSDSPIITATASTLESMNIYQPHAAGLSSRNQSYSAHENKFKEEERLHRNIILEIDANGLVRSDNEVVKNGTMLLGACGACAAVTGGIVLGAAGILVSAATIAALVAGYNQLADEEQTKLKSRTRNCLSGIVDCGKAAHEQILQSCQYAAQKGKDFANDPACVVVCNNSKGTYMCMRCVQCHQCEQKCDIVRDAYGDRSEHTSLLDGDNDDSDDEEDSALDNRRLGSGVGSDMLKNSRKRGYPGSKFVGDFSPSHVNNKNTMSGNKKSWLEEGTTVVAEEFKVVAEELNLVRTNIGLGASNGIGGEEINEEGDFHGRKSQHKVACFRRSRYIPVHQIHALEPSLQPRAWLDVMTSIYTSGDEQVEAMEEILLLAKDKTRARMFLEEGILDSLLSILSSFFQKYSMLLVQKQKQMSSTPDAPFSEEDERMTRLAQEQASKMYIQARLAGHCSVALGKAHCALVHTEGDLLLMSSYSRGSVPEARQLAQVLFEVPHHTRTIHNDDPHSQNDDPNNEGKDPYNGQLSVDDGGKGNGRWKESFTLTEMSMHQAEEIAKLIKALVDGKMDPNQQG